MHDAPPPPPAPPPRPKVKLTAAQARPLLGCNRAARRANLSKLRRGEQVELKIGKVNGTRAGVKARSGARARRARSR